MNEEQKRHFIDTIEERVRIVREAFKQLCVEHRCTVHHNPEDNIISFAFHVGEKDLTEDIASSLDERWRWAVFDTDTHELVKQGRSEAIRRYEEVMEKVNKLSQILPPHQMVMLMMKVQMGLQAGMSPEEILGEYDELLQQAEDGVRQANEDPTSLLCDFESLTDEDQDRRLDDLFGEND